jgi:hypothetical protein
MEDLNISNPLLFTLILLFSFSSLNSGIGIALLLRLVSSLISARGIFLKISDFKPKILAFLAGLK